jgi:transcriptional regulator with XRE-family HTH domain
MFIESNDVVKLMSSFNKRLQQLMEENGVKAADLARKTGLSKPTLSAIIHGTTNDPRISSLLSIARVLNCDPMWLFVGKSSADYASSISVSKVPVWELKDMVGQPHDALPLIDTGRHLIVEDGGHLCAVVAENDDLAASGVHKGDLLIIDMSPEQLTLSNDDIVLIEYKGRPMLLRAKNAIDGMNLVADDPHFGFVKSDDAIILGKMTELRRS